MTPSFSTRSSPLARTSPMDGSGWTRQASRQGGFYAKVNPSERKELGMICAAGAGGVSTTDINHIKRPADSLGLALDQLELQRSAEPIVQPAQRTVPAS